MTTSSAKMRATCSTLTIFPDDRDGLTGSPSAACTSRARGTTSGAVAPADEPASNVRCGPAQPTPDDAHSTVGGFVCRKKLDNSRTGVQER